MKKRYVLLIIIILMVVLIPSVNAEATFYGAGDVPQGSSGKKGGGSVSFYHLISVPFYKVSLVKIEGSSTSSSLSYIYLVSSSDVYKKNYSPFQTKNFYSCLYTNGNPIYGLISDSGYVYDESASIFAGNATQPKKGSTMRQCILSGENGIFKGTYDNILKWSGTGGEHFQWNAKGIGSNAYYNFYFAEKDGIYDYFNTNGEVNESNAAVILDKLDAASIISDNKFNNINDCRSDATCASKLLNYYIAIEPVGFFRINNNHKLYATFKGFAKYYSSEKDFNGSYVSYGRDFAKLVSADGYEKVNSNFSAKISNYSSCVFKDKECTKNYFSEIASTSSIYGWALLNVKDMLNNPTPTTTSPTEPKFCSASAENDLDSNVDGGNTTCGAEYDITYNNNYNLKLNQIKERFVESIKNTDSYKSCGNCQIHFCSWNVGYNINYRLSLSSSNLKGNDVSVYKNNGFIINQSLNYGYTVQPTFTLFDNMSITYELGNEDGSEKFGDEFTYTLSDDDKLYVRSLAEDEIEEIKSGLSLTTISDSGTFSDIGEWQCASSSENYINCTFMIKGSSWNYNNSSVTYDGGLSINNKYYALNDSIGSHNFNFIPDLSDSIFDGLLDDFSISGCSYNVLDNSSIYQYTTVDVKNGENISNSYEWDRYFNLEDISSRNKKISRLKESFNSDKLNYKVNGFNLSAIKKLDSDYPYSLFNEIDENGKLNSSLATSMNIIEVTNNGFGYNAKGYYDKSKEELK